MGNRDWYRRVTWTTKDREDFLSRLKRSRTLYNKSQYLRIQAYTLQTEANPPQYEAALELLDLLFREEPDKSQLAAAFHQRAKCLEALGRIDDALAAYRDAIRIGLNRSGIQTTDAPLHFGACVIKNRLESCFEEVLKCFEGIEMVLLFPESQYLYHSIMAVIGQADERRKEAVDHARKALEIAKRSGSSDPIIDKMVGECIGGCCEPIA